MSTHLMEEADRLCNRVALMFRGKLIVSGSPEELKRSIHKRASAWRMCSFFITPKRYQIPINTIILLAGEKQLKGYDRQMRRFLRKTWAIADFVVW